MVRCTTGSGRQSESAHGEAVKRNGRQEMSRTRRLLVAGAIVLALMVSGTPTADAATSGGDVGTQRFCWWTNC